MTEQAAIERIKDHFKIHDDGRPTPYLNEAVNMAINALKELMLYKQASLCLIPSDVYEKQCQELDKLKEKNTPKKPYPPIVTVALGSCGMCNTPLFAKHKYCHNCGQAIDWEQYEMKKPAEGELAAER